MALRVSLRDAWILGARDLEDARPRKYRNRPGDLDGHSFDSQLELKRYARLVHVEMAGGLTSLAVHPKFDLFAAVFRGDETHCESVGIYEADFSYVDEQGQEVVEDCKGVSLPFYKLKRAIFLANYRRFKFIEVRLKRKRWISKVVSPGDRHDQ